VVLIIAVLCRLTITSVYGNKVIIFLEFKLSPRSQCCILSFGWFLDVWILWGRFGTRRYEIQTPGNHPKERIQLGYNNSDNKSNQWAGVKIIFVYTQFII